MLSALFPIQTNSLISFHEHSSVLLHQCTTWKELLSVLSLVDTIDNPLHRHPDIPRADIPPPPSNPKSTQPYYTNTVLPIEEWRHPDIPRADIPPPPSNPKSTQPYYTNTVLPIEEWRHPDIPRADIPHPPLIDPKSTEPYYTNYSISYRRMQTSWHTQDRHSSVIVDQQLKLNKNKNNITK